MKNTITVRPIVSLILITCIGYGAALVAAQEQERQAQGRLQDKQRVAKLTTNELRYELDLRWQRIRTSSIAISKRVFECVKKWIRVIEVYMSRHGGSPAHIDVDNSISRAGFRAGQNIFNAHGRGVFLLTVPRYKEDANWLLLPNYIGEIPAADREYFDCLYDITVDAEIAAIGHIYKLTPQEEADIKAKAKANPLKNPYMKK